MIGIHFKREFSSESKICSVLRLFDLPRDGILKPNRLTCGFALISARIMLFLLQTLGLLVTLAFFFDERVHLGAEACKLDNRNALCFILEFADHFLVLRTVKLFHLAITHAEQVLVLENLLEVVPRLDFVEERVWRFDTLHFADSISSVSLEEQQLRQFRQKNFRC